MKEISRVIDIKRREIKVAVEDDFGEQQEITIALQHDKCPCCQHPYMKTALGVVDVDATIAAVADDQQPHHDAAIASFEACGVSMKDVKARRDARLKNKARKSG